MSYVIRNRLIGAALALVLFVLFLIPRLRGLDEYVTRDEPVWLSMGTNFYYALGQREFENTVYEYQPAVTTMWLVTGATLYYFPEYRGLGQGYLEYEKDILDSFLLQHGRRPLQLLIYTRTLQVILVSALLVIAGLLIWRLVGGLTAFVAAALVAYDPFFMGQSRILSHEALLSLFALISLLSALIYLQHGRKPVWLVASAVAAALAQLTKSSGMVLFPVIVLMFAVQARSERRSSQGVRAALWQQAKPLLAWFVLTTLAYIALWPGMWVAPGKMLYQVYGNAFSYAFQGARLKLTGALSPSEFELDLGVMGILDHLRVLVWRTTPVTWFGTLLGLSLRFLKQAGPGGRSLRAILAYIGLLGVLYVLVFGVAQGRNSPHYILSAYVSLNVIAAAGWVAACEWFMERQARHVWARLLPAALIGVIGLQAASALRFHPFYFTYYNPVLEAARPGRQYPLFTYGEGLEHAARYLAARPNAAGLTVISYYGRGCFSYFFPGPTLILKPPLFLPGNQNDLVESIRAADYLVIYPPLQRSLPAYEAFLEALEPFQPEHAVHMNGIEYARIYPVQALSADFFEILVEEYAG